MSILSAAVKVGGGVIGAQLLAALAVPILTRLYSPAAFSLFAYCFSIASILSTACYLRLEVLVSKCSEGECRSLIMPALSRLARMMAPVLLLAAVLIQIFFPPPLEGNVFVNASLICAAAISFASFNVHAIFLAKRKEYVKMGVSRLLRSASAVFFQLLLVLAGKAIFLFVGEVIGRIIGAMSIRRQAGKKERGARGDLIRVVKGNVELLQYGFPALFINSIALNIYPIALAANYSPKLVGVYFLVHKMVATPITLVAQSISVALLGDMSRHLPGNKFALRSEMLRIFLILIPLGFAFFCILWLLAKNFSHVLFGPGWDGAAEVIVLLIPLLTLQVSATPFSQLLNVLGYSRTQFGWDVSRLAVVVLSFVIPLMLPSNPVTDFRLTLMMYSFGSATLYLIHFFLVRNALSAK